MYYKEIRYILEKDRIYNTPIKQEIRDILIDKYILPKLEKGKEVSVLDFFGTGLFAERLVKRLDDHRGCVKNHNYHVNLYEIENDKKLHSYMREFVDQIPAVKNQDPFVNIIPFYGSLANFVHSKVVKNQPLYDLIWLDHCGIATKDNTSVIKPLVGNDTVIAVTSTIISGGSSMRNKSLVQLDSDVKSVFAKDFPLMNVNRLRTYRNMAVYISKIPSYVKRNLPMIFCEKPVGLCEEVPVI